ncbi:hypothetical protein FRC12_016047 [Ceratobasidium sp. 428]|nr:hypothetical protein FRC12_016047 [Ceratobasidium sp. 428]
MHHINCYTGIWGRKPVSGTPFRVTLSNVLVFASKAHKQTMPEVASKGSIGKVLQSNEVKIVVIILSTLMILILSSTLPNVESYVARPVESMAAGVAKAAGRCHYI